MCSAAEGPLQHRHCSEVLDTCVIIPSLLLIFIRVISGSGSGDEDRLSAAVTVSEAGSQLAEADTVWPGRPEAPSDSQECSVGHTQSSDISESGRVSSVSLTGVKCRHANTCLLLASIPDYYYRVADTRPQRVKVRLDMRMVMMRRMARRVTRVTSPTASWRT